MLFALGMILLQQEAGVGALEIGGTAIGGSAVIGLGTYVGKKLFDRLLGALDKNTEALDRLGTDLSDHKTETAKSINLVNESVIQQGMRMDDGFATVNDRLDKGAEKHDEFTDNHERMTERIGKASQNISDLKLKVTMIEGKLE